MITKLNLKILKYTSKKKNNTEKNTLRRIHISAYSLN